MPGVKKDLRNLHSNNRTQPDAATPPRCCEAVGEKSVRDSKWRNLGCPVLYIPASVSSFEV
jgi:hypothetical protein